MAKTVNCTNQENAAYPLAFCAERVLLSAACNVVSHVAIDSIAISYIIKRESDHPISPCGYLQADFTEYEERVKQPIDLILSGFSRKNLYH